MVNIDKTSALPIIRQIYLQLRTAILEGRLKAGERIPSTREMAHRLSVSRNVVLEAYDLLIAEGYLEGKHGSGTRVAVGAFLEGGLSGETRMQESDVPNPKSDLIDFRSGVPALDFFPIRKWGRILQEICREMPSQSLAYDRPEGCPELRRVLADYLYKSRGLTCDPKVLFITSGATQGLSLAAKLFYGDQAVAVVEDPLNDGMRQIFDYAGYRLEPVPVDELGLRTELLPTGAQPRFVYVTPSHQFPLGGLLPIQRRIELIQYARRKNITIIEDDYDSEFRYGGPPVSTLRELAPDRVVYIGSFSKILAPALRLGYMILPTEMAERYRRLKRVADVHTPLLEQLALARFIGEGALERHVARLRKIYNRRRRVMIDSLQEHFPGRFETKGDATGLHLIAEFPELEFTDDVLRKLKGLGVRIYPVERHAIRKGAHTHQVILGYSHLEEEKIREGIRRMSLYR